MYVIQLKIKNKSTNWLHLCKCHLSYQQHKKERLSFQVAAWARSNTSRLKQRCFFFWKIKSCFQNKIFLIYISTISVTVLQPWQYFSEVTKTLCIWCDDLCPLIWTSPLHMGLVLLASKAVASTSFTSCIIVSLAYTSFYLLCSSFKILRTSSLHQFSISVVYLSYFSLLNKLLCYNSLSDFFSPWPYEPGGHSRTLWSSKNSVHWEVIP